MKVFIAVDSNSNVINIGDYVISTLDRSICGIVCDIKHKGNDSFLTIKDSETDEIIIFDVKSTFFSKRKIINRKKETNFIMNWTQKFGHNKKEDKNHSI